MVRRGAHAKPMSWRGIVASLVGLAVLGLGSGAAYGYFTSSATGHGAMALGTTQIALVTDTATPSGVLLPGEKADVTLTVHNPNDYPVTLTTVVGDGTVTASGGKGTCTTTGVTFLTQTGITGHTIPATSTKSFHFATAAQMSTISTTGCQGATFSIPVTITVHQ